VPAKRCAAPMAHTTALFLSRRQSTAVFSGPRTWRFRSGPSGGVPTWLFTGLAVTLSVFGECGFGRESSGSSVEGTGVQRAVIRGLLARTA